MTKAEQRAAIEVEVRRRMHGPEPVARLADLVEEWRSLALSAVTPRAIEARRCAECDGLTTQPQGVCLRCATQSAMVRP